MMQTKYWVIIAAAGVGARFASATPKQYQSLQGKPVIEHTLSKFLYHPQVEKIVVTLDANDYFWPRLRLDTFNDKIMVATGGKIRSQSVLSGLKAISSFANPQDFVLVHDAVRPCLHREDINKLITTVGNHPVGGILASRVRDTLKYANEANEIVDTVSRENIWQALTPQMFRYQILSQALQQTSHDHAVTDEAGAIEALGFVPMIVEGRRDNIKITYPEDLVLAQKYL
jgi:2-C-methyl-D-erythritol 4-phosphate cytidylyltransferase